MPRGGPRPNAGRKKKTDKNKTAIERAEKQIRDQLPQVINTLQKLAFGGIPQVEDKWIPRVAFSQGDLIALAAEKGDGEPVDLEELLGGDPKEMVLSERKTSHTLPDRAALIYLANRIMGTPKQRTELSFETMSNAELIAFITGKTPGPGGA
jgi:hypothetical protein